MQNKGLTQLMIEDLAADYRSGKIYHVNTPLLTVNTTHNSVYIHLPNWPLEPEDLQQLHSSVISGLEEAEG